MITEQEFIERYDRGDKFTEKELSYLCIDFPQVGETEGDMHRWDIEMTTIIEACGRTFAINWRCGLTECQENYYDSQPVEVDKHEYQKTITVTEWIPVKKRMSE